MEFENITLRCDCNAEAVVFTKYNYADGDKSYGISFEDDYKKSQFSGLFGRFKRAWYAFKSKPVVHMDVFTDDKSKMRKFLTDCLTLINADDSKKYYDGIDPYYLEHRKDELDDTVFVTGLYAEDDSVTSNEQLIKECKWVMTNDQQL